MSNLWLGEQQEDVTCCALSISLCSCPDPCPLSLHGSEWQHPTGARARNLPRDLGMLVDGGTIRIFFHFPNYCLGLAAEYQNFTLIQDNFFNFSFDCIRIKFKVFSLKTEISLFEKTSSLPSLVGSSNPTKFSKL